MAKGGSGPRGLRVLVIRFGRGGIPGFLVLVEASIGGFEKFWSRHTILWIDGTTDAHGKRRKIRLRAETTGNAIGDTLAAFAVGLQQENCKLISSVAGGDVRGAAVVLHHTGQPVQGAVPSQMAEAVVNGFQIVEIQRSE